MIQTLNTGKNTSYHSDKKMNLNIVNKPCFRLKFEN